MLDFSSGALSGAVDGQNTLFVTSAPMAAGSTAVFLNGLCLDPNLDTGWSAEDARTVRLREPPYAGDTVCVLYERQQAPAAPAPSAYAFVASARPSLQSAQTLRPTGLATAFATPAAAGNTPAPSFVATPSLGPTFSSNTLAPEIVL